MSWTVGVGESGQVVKGLSHSLLEAPVNGVQKPDLLAGGEKIRGAI